MALFTATNILTGGTVVLVFEVALSQGISRHLRHHGVVYGTSGPKFEGTPISLCYYSSRSLQRNKRNTKDYDQQHFAMSLCFKSLPACTCEVSRDCRVGCPETQDVLIIQGALANPIFQVPIQGPKPMPDT
ncbi:hypothetical protein F4780DRAFT_74960 [Xylariomycetidae sp. FL0641]|nr:hypothetical protein F4780DRAFT_74960 [Xylariomycetidae sp. FL0641]